MVFCSKIKFGEIFLLLLVFSNIDLGLSGDSDCSDADENIPSDGESVQMPKKRTARRKRTNQMEPEFDLEKFFEELKLVPNYKPRKNYENVTASTDEYERFLQNVRNEKKNEKNRRHREARGSDENAEIYRYRKREDENKGYVRTNDYENIQRNERNNRGKDPIQNIPTSSDDYIFHQSQQDILEKLLREEERQRRKKNQMEEYKKQNERKKQIYDDSDKENDEKPAKKKPDNKIPHKPKITPDIRRHTEGGGRESLKPVSKENVQTSPYGESIKPDIKPFTSRPVRNHRSTRESKPLTSRPDIKPVMIQPESKPLTSRPDIKPVMIQPERKPLASRPVRNNRSTPESKPLTSRPDMKPVKIQPESKALTSRPVRNHRSVIPESKPLTNNRRNSDSFKVLSNPHSQFKTDNTPVLRSKHNGINVSHKKPTVPVIKSARHRESKRHPLFIEVDQEDSKKKTRKADDRPADVGASKPYKKHNRRSISTSVEGINFLSIADFKNGISPQTETEDVPVHHTQAKTVMKAMYKRLNKNYTQLKKYEYEGHQFWLYFQWGTLMSKFTKSIIIEMNENNLKPRYAELGISFDEKMWKQHFDSPRFLFLEARTGRGRVAGFVHFTYEYSTDDKMEILLLSTVQVGEEYEGMLLEKRMIDILEVMCHSFSIKRIVIKADERFKNLIEYWAQPIGFLKMTKTIHDIVVAIYAKDVTTTQIQQY